MTERGTASIGVIGLAVMGENLVLNLESRGHTVAVYNRTPERVERFVVGRGAGKSILGATSLAELVEKLERPRAILLMIKAGGAVDDMIEQLLPLLDAGDILIDGGNSHYADTIRRVERLDSAGLHFVGTGVSGGEEGALLGPSIMPGGDERAWPKLGPILESIAARAPDGSPCCAWVGPGGAGHFVKMVHNGIEYGDMQMIAEAYSLLRSVGGLTNREAADVFERWNKGALESFLVEITAEILRTPDDLGDGDLIDAIRDVAGQKGTGKWTSVTALDVGSPASTIAEAVFARCLSAQPGERQQAAALYPPAPRHGGGDPAAFVEKVGRALLASKVCSYAQGFQLMRLAARDFGWTLDLARVALLWRAGCIIRAAFLDDIAAAFRRSDDLENLLLDAEFVSTIRAAEPDWRDVVATSALAGIWTPTFSSALAYFDGFRSERLPTSLVQAQRDYFGAHTYERVDRPVGEVFHTDWTGHGGATSSTSYTV